MRAVLSVLVSLAVHGLLAAALAWWFAHAPAPDTLASLDLTSVELSFADEEDSAAALSALPPASEPPPVRPACEPMSAPVDDPPDPLPPEPDALRLPHPDPEHTQLPEREIERVPREETPAPPPAPAPSAAPRQARIDAPPRPQKAIRPEYPKGARQRGEQGQVTLELAVDARGGVASVRVVETSGFADLDEAAVRAARAARFNPALSGKTAVASTARLKLAFKLK